jgi:hypothetical protein
MDSFEAKKKYKFHATILFGTGDYAMLNRALDSLLPQLLEYSNEEYKIVIYQKSDKADLDYGKINIKHSFTSVHVYKDFLYPQVLNYALRTAIEEKEDFMFQFHDDALALPGLIKGMIEKYEEVKNDKWSAIFGGAGDHCSFYNHRYNETFNSFYDAFLFPHYFMDNHYFRIASLRGWPIVDVEPKLTIHEGSAGLSVGNFRIKNGVSFPHSAALYASIWGGSVGNETIVDPNARGVVD